VSAPALQTAPSAIGPLWPASVLQTSSLSFGLVGVVVEGFRQTRVEPATRAKPAGRAVDSWAPLMPPVVSLL
jgi:hypothetical protein